MATKRYCPMCGRWFGARVKECPACGMDTEKEQKADAGGDR
jgi:uncharacterized protein (DUF983 family)